MPKIKLRAAQHSLLLEALRRRQLHEGKTDPLKPLEQDWTGLGFPSEYKPVVEAGLMEGVHGETARVMNWYRLTAKGALIVQKWLDEGYDFDEGRWPPLVVEIEE